MLVISCGYNTRNICGEKSMSRFGGRENWSATKLKSHIRSAKQFSVAMFVIILVMPLLLLALVVNYIGMWVTNWSGE